MKKTRWLAILLLISWTLNVALVVAYFVRSNSDSAAGFSDLPRFSGLRDPVPGIPPDMQVEFQAETAPLHRLRARLMQEISTTLAADELDSIRLICLGDSLNTVRCDLQRKLFTHLGRLHADLPPEARQRLSGRMCRMLDDRRPGADRHKDRMSGRRFKSDRRGK
ncbi:hypothetical protein HQ587_04010 [bacterium]|nr:hypothetical protein [bacterium]